MYEAGASGLLYQLRALRSAFRTFPPPDRAHKKKEESRTEDEEDRHMGTLFILALVYESAVRIYFITN